MCLCLYIFFVAELTASSTIFPALVTLPSHDYHFWEKRERLLVSAAAAHSIPEAVLMSDHTNTTADAAATTAETAKGKERERTCGRVNARSKRARLVKGPRESCNNMIMRHREVKKEGERDCYDDHRMSQRMMIMMMVMAVQSRSLCCHRQVIVVLSVCLAKREKEAKRVQDRVREREMRGNKGECLCVCTHSNASLVSECVCVCVDTLASLEERNGGK